MIKDFDWELFPCTGNGMEKNTKVFEGKADTRVIKTGITGREKAGVGLAVK